MGRVLERLRVMLWQAKLTARRWLNSTSASKLSSEGCQLDVHGTARLLVHDTSLAVTVGILLGVELVHQAWLASISDVMGVGAEIGT
jgi:hypothetical protein